LQGDTKGDVALLWLACNQEKDILAFNDRIF